MRELKTFDGVARGLLPVLVVLYVVPLCLFAGCVYPAPLELDSPDAGPSAPPVIIASGPAPEFALPGPLFLDRSLPDQTFSLTVVDNDSIDESLFVRLFIDYGMPDQQPASSSCSLPPGEGVERVGECLLSPVCNDIEPEDEELHFLEAVIADRPFLDETARPPEQPPYRGLPADAAYSVRAWTLACTGGVPQ
jgi:hypothetical protein